MFYQCSCVSEIGKPKRLYFSREEAQDTANHRRSCGGGELRVYECPDGLGYHLTKKLKEWSIYG